MLKVSRILRADKIENGIYSMPLDDAIDEHVKLVRALESPSHVDDMEEAKEQGAELKEMLAAKKTASTDIAEYSDEDLKTDWLEILDEIEWDIPAALIERIVKLHNFHYEWKLKKRMLLINDKVWLLFDPEKKTLDYIKDIQRWANELDSMELEDIVGDVADLYNPLAEESLNDLRQHPGDVYHYTTAEAVEKIKASGFLQGSSGTGLTNRSSYGVFTSLDPETNASGTYGDILLKIDLTSFLRDNPKVAISWEPEIEECIMRDALEGGLGLEGYNEPDSSGGMSYDTVIVCSNIPMKYISVEGQ